MITNNNIPGKIPDNETKKVWMLPELEVLNGRRTYSDYQDGPAESDDYEDNEPS